MKFQVIFCHTIDTMTAIKLDGEQLAAKIKAQLQSRIDALREKGIVPGLGTVLVGDDGPSANYVAMKHRDCEELGMVSQHEHLPADATQEEIHAVVDHMNASADVHAYLDAVSLSLGILTTSKPCCGWIPPKMWTDCTL